MNSYWMWNFGDFEIYHINQVDSRRQEHSIDYPAMWIMPQLMPTVIYYCDYESPEDSSAKVTLNGKGNIRFDHGAIQSIQGQVTVPAGKHTAEITLFNNQGLPAAFVESDVIPSGPNWYTRRDGVRIPVGFYKEYADPTSSPEKFAFRYQPIHPVNRESINGGTLLDYGDEWFGPVTLSNVKESDSIYIGYGESREEALDVDRSIIFDHLTGKTEYTLPCRCFRYLYLTGNADVQVDALYEYQDLEYKGSFHCDDEDINRIIAMCQRTFHLNSREVILDGIKRDRWLWSGDAYQGYKINDYLFLDHDLMQRCILSMNGPRPWQQNINTILDYSMYWIISQYEYYETFAQTQLLEILYPDAVAMMDYIARRENADGFLAGLPQDWIFIDWSEIDKTGAVCAEQMLYIQANKAMSKICALLGKDGSRYEEKYQDLMSKIDDFYWNEEKGGYIDSYESGKNQVTRHANIFAILYDIASPEKVEMINRCVLHNDAITKITTPYFEGFELDAMGKIGDTDYIENMLHSYWKGMLDLGATTVWEEFDPRMSGTDHYHMYNTPYGKSLCHAWGSTPIYLLGRYYLGVYPTKPGYETFEVKPFLGHFKEIDGTVPVLGGLVTLKATADSLEVTADRDGGTVLWKGQSYPLEAGRTLKL